MTAVWAPRHEDLLRACVVSPHVFAHLVDRLCDVVAPSQHCLETEASQHNLKRRGGPCLDLFPWPRFPSYPQAR
jgi:hypothetical protein